MTTEDILKIQDLAIRTKNEKLRVLAWTALGYSCRIGFIPVTVWEQEEAVARLAALPPTL